MWSSRYLFFFLTCLMKVLIAETINENSTVNVSSISSSNKLSRQKRYLIFPDGSNLQLIYCLTVGAYGRKEDLVMGMTAALAWELPSKFDPKITTLIHRRTRSVAYPKIEAFLQAIGFDGRSCVMKALCEAGQRDPSEIGKGTFVQELLHTIFTLPKDGRTFENYEHKVYDDAYETKEDCERRYPTCRYSIYKVNFLN